MDIYTTTDDPRYHELATRYVGTLCSDALHRPDRGTRRLIFLRKDLGGDERVRPLEPEAAMDLIEQIREENFRETVRAAYEMHDPAKEATILLSLMGGGLGLLVVRYADLAEDIEDLPDVPTGALLN